MTYSISSISNRDLQLLFHYRILRQPSDYLKAVYTRGAGEVLTFAPIGMSNDDPPEYQFQATTSGPANKVPLLEFTGDEEDWAQVAYLTTLEVNGKTLTLKSQNESLGDMTITCYWVDSIDQLNEILAEYLIELKSLQSELDALDKRLAELDDGKGTATVSGIPDNLVKIKTTDDGKGLTDALYRIVEPTVSQHLQSPSEADLAKLVPDIDGDISITVTDNRPRTLQGLYGKGSISISGSGIWYLIGITNDVLLINFTGTVYAYGCPSVRVNKNCNVKRVTLVNSFMVHALGTVQQATLVRNSTYKHNSGKLVELAHVGVGCEYYSQISRDMAAVNEPVFDWANIQGTACLANGIIIMNGREVSFITGHHDDPMQISTVDIEVSGDPTKDEADENQDPDPSGGDDRDPIAGNTPEIKIYNWLLVNTTLTKPAICGALGNFKQESGYDPFVHGSYYGLWQTNRAALRTAMTEAGLDSLWHTAPAWTSWEGHCTEAQWDQAIAINLQVLVNTGYNSDGFSYYKYNECLGYPTHQIGADGARSYAELFCGMVERCVGGTDALTDPGVANFMLNYIYKGRITQNYLYQQLVQRRDYAAQTYNSLVGG